MNTIELVMPTDILYLEASQSNTKVILQDNRTLLCNESLKTREEKMKLEDGFMRIHNSYIINLYHVVRYYRSGMVELHGGKTIPVARRRKQDFVTNLSALMRP